MPKTSSAKKALRQTIRRREHNAKKKKELRAIVKNYRKLVVAKEKEKASEYLKTAYKALDKAAKTNIIKKNTASRLKARLSKKLKTLA